MLTVGEEGRDALEREKGREGRFYLIDDASPLLVGFALSRLASGLDGCQGAFVLDERRALLAKRVVSKCGGSGHGDYFDQVNMRIYGEHSSALAARDLGI